MSIHPPRHVVWSTDTINEQNPFQRRWLLQQTLIHGRMEDIRKLRIQDIANELDNLNLPEDIHSLWKKYLEYRHVGKQPVTR
jgi:hypothetical protein